jgi:hypothetical protein
MMPRIEGGGVVDINALPVRSMKFDIIAYADLEADELISSVPSDADMRVRACREASRSVLPHIR